MSKRTDPLTLARIQAEAALEVFTRLQLEAGFLSAALNVSDGAYCFVPHPKKELPGTKFRKADYEP
jgi:hypothetical protein